MNTRLLTVAVLCIAWAGCSKQPEKTVPAAVPLVAAQERSGSFERVNRELELGGTLYGYADIDGDGLKLARMTQVWMRQLAPISPALAKAAEQDYPAIFTALGLNDVIAIGISSVPAGGGEFRNRAFLYTPGGRHGLMAVVGGPPAPFVHPRMAPADADLYGEMELDVPVAYRASRDLVAKISGQAAADRMEDQLKNAGVKAGFSMLDIIDGLKGRMTVIGRVEPGKTYVLPGRDGLVLPQLSLVIGVEGVGRAVEGALLKLLMFDQSLKGTGKYFRLKQPSPVSGLDLVIMVDGTALYVATSPAFLDECLERTSGLDQNPEFQRLLAELGPEGNAVSYVTPRFFEECRRLADLNPRATASTLRMLNAVAALIPTAPHPLMLVRQNLPDGILVRARYNRSFKQELLLPAVYNPLTLGLLVAVTVAQRNRVASQAQNTPPFGPPVRQGLVPGQFGSGPDGPPVPMVQTKPEYPLGLRYRHIEGVVMLDFVVDTLGRVQRPRVLMTPDPAFSQAAVTTVSRWQFRPAMKAGRPVSTHLEEPIVFSQDPESERNLAAAAIGKYYTALRDQWRAKIFKTGPGNRPAQDWVMSFSAIWARIGTDSRGVPVIENVGHGPEDPGALELRSIIEQSLTEPESEAMLSRYLKQVGYIDLAFPSPAGAPRALLREDKAGP